MASLPAVCPNGHLYADEGIVGGDGTIENSIIENMSASRPCPTCRRVGKLVDGTYEMAQGVMAVLGRPEWTAERMQELQAVIDQAPDMDAAMEAVRSRFPDLLASVPVREA